jgi:hypothetical protein
MTEAIMQIFVAILFFYVFGLAAIIMTYFVVRAILAFLRTTKKKQE